MFFSVEFICFLESAQCSGEMKRKVRKHLTNNWKNEIQDNSFSKSYFNAVGTWKPISLGRGSLVYEKKGFEALFYSLKFDKKEDKLKVDRNILDPQALAQFEQLTLILGTQSYFEPEGAELQVDFKFCCE